MRIARILKKLGIPMLSLDVFLNPFFLPIARLLVRYKCVAVFDLSLWLDNRIVFVVKGDNNCMLHSVCKGLYAFVQKLCPRPYLEFVYREAILEKITRIQLS